MVQDKDKVYLQHILDEIYRIDVFLEGKDMDEFLSSDITETHYAVVRSLEIVGEAASKLSSELKEQYPQVPWVSIVGMRNKIIHEYMGVDYEVVWETIKSDLPKLREVVETLLK